MNKQDTFFCLVIIIVELFFLVGIAVGRSYAAPEAPAVIIQTVPETVSETIQEAVLETTLAGRGVGFTEVSR